MGAPNDVVRVTEADEPIDTRVTEATDTIPGRVLESKGADEHGARIFRCQIVAYGESRNRMRYTEAVMRKAVPLYEGAKAFDHHRTIDELRTSTISGMVGSYRNVVATSAGIEADLCLLPSATHTAEALDASLAAQARNLPALVGISHDVALHKRDTVGAGGKRVQEAVEILSVNSADVVADPSAGGRATRMVAGGSGTLDEQENTMTLEELLDMLSKATPEQKATVQSSLGISADVLEKIAKGEPVVEPATVDEPAEPEKVLATVGAPSEAEQATEATLSRGSISGRLVVKEAVGDAGLDARMAEAIVAGLPERFTEADVATQIEGIKRVTEGLEAAGLKPTVPAVTAGKDEVDRKTEALDAMFDGTPKGYRSFKQAYIDFTGNREDPLGEDFNRQILRESFGGSVHENFDSGRRTESADTTTWGLALGDSITRRMVAEYAQPSLQAWRQLVSATPPVNDFRTQRIDRLGGYGTLPAVAQGAPYQPLTTPGNEESTYALTKRGGLEDLTLETIANDDLRLIQRIPKRLGLAAAQTLYRFVFDLLDTNVVCTFDSVALFAAGHGSNTASLTLGQSGLNAARLKMSKQAAYGDTKDILDIDIKYLLVPADLWEMGWQLSTSAVALPTGSPSIGAANTPNINQSITPIRVPYWTTATSWYAVADPAMVPTIEIGFYQGRQEPELFSQVDPTVGSVFSADKITYKIRHIYSGTVLDYRGFFRGTA